MVKTGVPMRSSIGFFHLCWNKKALPVEPDHLGLNLPDTWRASKSSGRWQGTRTRSVRGFEDLWVERLVNIFRQLRRLRPLSTSPHGLQPPSFPHPCRRQRPPPNTFPIFSASSRHPASFAPNHFHPNRSESAVGRRSSRRFAWASPRRARPSCRSAFTRRTWTSAVVAKRGVGRKEGAGERGWTPG